MTLINLKGGIKNYGFYNINIHWCIFRYVDLAEYVKCYNMNNRGIENTSPKTINSSTGGSKN